jgi:hypothetical protein
MTELEQYPLGIDYSRQMRWDENKVFRSYPDYSAFNATQFINFLTESWQDPPWEPMDIEFKRENWAVYIWVEEQALLASRFYTLVQQWKKETAHYSVIARRYQHEAYKKILRLGSAAVPYILEELRRNPDRWFSALVKLTGANPAEHAKTFYEAVDKWIAWGIQNHHLKDATFKLSP